LFKNSTHLVQNVQGLQDENRDLKRQLEQMIAQAANSMQKELSTQTEMINGVKTVIKKLDLSDMNAAKTLAHNLEKEIGESVICFGIDQGDKANLLLLISNSLVESKSLNAGQIIREIVKHIQGGGGGQAFYASAGGKNPSGIGEAFNALKGILNKH
jgi:alanyl-tRNA synthetase